MQQSKNELELYLHIPFCVRKCNYCDFLSGPSDLETIRRYVDALCEEIKSYSYLSKDYTISTIFIGGGTPSILKIGYIENIIKTIREAFGIPKASLCVEATIECNPGTLDRDKLIGYQRAGINRLSLGLQSADNEELRLLGRIHTYEEFCSNYQLARDIGFQQINIDLMAALPGQTLKSYEETLLKILALNPEHISAYSLILEEGTNLYQLYHNQKDTTAKPLPSEEEERLMYEMTKTLLEKAGYVQYEISNFAKPGFECRHNIGYWKRTEYLGLGLGASSLLSNTRFSNETDISLYIENWNTLKLQLRRDILVLSQKEQMEEFMFLGLRMINGISKTEFYKEFQTKYLDVYNEVTEKLVQKGLLIDTEDCICLTPYGRDISNIVLAEFLL